MIALDSQAFIEVRQRIKEFEKWAAGADVKEYLTIFRDILRREIVQDISQRFSVEAAEVELLISEIRDQLVASRL